MKDLEMNTEQVTEMLDYITSVVPNFKVDDSMIKAWFNELQQYDIDDVKLSLKQIIDQYGYPTLSQITKGLTKKHEKIDFKEQVTRCQRCNRIVREEDYDAHFDRCSSIDYVIRETKKWFRKELTRKFLWEMSEEEFNERYNKLLHYIHDHTTDESERTRIGFIFNPPSREQAKAFLDGEH